MSRLSVLSVVALAALMASVSALTVEIQPHESSCFFQDATKVGQRMHFSFAVQSGGSFDIDFEVKDPQGQVLNSGSAEKDGEFIFTVQQIGEYGFCFSNAMSTFAQKVVTFDIDVSGESKTVTKTSSDEIARKEVEPIQVSTDSIKEGLIKIDRTLSFYRTRERRNFDTVYQTESRVFWTTVIECALIVGMAALQVFVVRSFFSVKGRQRA